MGTSKRNLTLDDIHELSELPSVIAARRKAAQDRLTPRRPPVPGKLDPGIRKAVETLQAGGIETFESCEGGPRHAYPEPTVRFYGRDGAGWRALAVCFDHGLPVESLRRIWPVLDGNAPSGPYWEITFRERVF